MQFDIGGQPYGPDEQAYLTRRAMHISVGQWEALSAEKREELCAKELWVAENFEAFREEEIGRAGGQVRAGGGGGGGKKKKKQ